MSELEKAYLDSLVVMKGDYPYFVCSLSDGQPALTKEVVDEVTERILEQGPLECDLILAPEAMGIPYALALTVRTGIPFQIIRKKRTGLPGEIEISQKTGYSESKMYLHSVPKGTEVIIVDDVLSTGGTLTATVKMLQESGIIVKEAIIVLDKSKDHTVFEKELGIRIRTLLHVNVSDGKPSIG